MSSGAWHHQPVLVADRARLRWTGLRPRARGRGLLLAGRSVHGRGMAEPLLVVAIDGAGAVIGHAVLEAGATIRLPGAVAVLELPGSVPAPPVGARLVWDRLRG